MSELPSIEQRLEAVSELAVQIASGDLQARLPLSERNDAVDAVVAALNALAEELQDERHSRRRAEELLADELDAYEHAPALLCSLDAENLILEKCNETLTAALGRSKPALLGRSVLELYQPEERGRAERALRELGPGVTRDAGDSLLSGTDGALIVSTTLTRVRAADGRERLRIVWRDVTKERGLEARLLESQKLEALGRLCGGVAHDFNNLLAVISGAAGLTRDLLVEHQLRSEDISLILQAVTRGAALINDLLAFSRRQVVKPEATDVRAIVTETARMVSRLVGTQIEVATEIADLSLTVLIDPSQLSQVLVNLAINARDAMRSGGTLRFAARRLDIDSARPRQGEPPDLPSGAYVLIAVSDSGTGMTPNVMARAVEPFFTTKPVGSGSGLGLSMCYGIIQQAGGRISIESRLGQGTTINVYLPRTGEMSVAAPQAEPPLVPRGKETLLVVEDDLAVCNVTRRILERAGYHVLVADNGQRALEAVESSTSEIALVVSDISMPGMSGQELGAELRQRNPKTRILYLSGYSPHVVTGPGSGGSDTDFLSKPFTSSGLLDKVRRLLERE